MEESKKVDIKVISTPTEIQYDCPHCEEEINIKYNDFMYEAGKVCDWQYRKIQCPECGQIIQIDNVDWV